MSNNTEDVNSISFSRFAIIQKIQAIGAAFVLLGFLIIAISSILINTINGFEFGAYVNLIGFIAVVIGLFMGLILSEQ